MVPLVLVWVIMVAGLAGLAALPPSRPALPYWALLSGLACALAAAAIASQPLGQATLPGRLGSAVIRWGFRASQGRLLPAVAISWLVWLMLGAAVIAAARARGDLPYRLMILAWTVDVGALFYVTGVWLTRAGTGGSAAPSLLMIAGVLLAMLAGSALLWWAVASPGARRIALLLAGGPPLFLGVGYGCFLLLTLIVGRHARWN